MVVIADPDDEFGFSAGDEAALLAVEDDFDLSSGDEAALLAVADSTALQMTSNGSNRKHARTESYRASLPATKAAKLDTDDQVILDLANSILETKFGMQAFRLKQAQAITRVLKGESAVVVFPTGGGKSLCYQVPGVAMRHLDRIKGERQGHGGSGITLVVSPLIALMKDQVDALKRRNISAAQLDSTRSREQYIETMDAIKNGTLDILYCAPERLNNEGFVSTIAHVQGGVRLLAIDEAHCISEWGHAFRPDYLKIARFAKEIQAERVLCLTATATPKVAEDVCQAFDIPKEGLFRTPSHRPNLKLMARSFMTKEESYPELIKFLKAHPGPTIIYVTLQRHSEDLANRIERSGLRARPFHAGMKTEEKSACQDDFMASGNLIICATIAFGMGIDKANIRSVIHYDSPKSLEGYSQEIGRAGRDGKPSFCMLYLCAEDSHLRESFARGDLPSKKSVVNLLNEVFDMVPGTSGCIEANARQQSKAHDVKETVLKNIFAQLELRFELLRESTPKYTKYSWKTLGSIDGDKSPAARAIRGNGTKKVTNTYLDVDRAARSGGVTREAIVATLQEWNNSQLIELKTEGVLNVYRVHKPLPKAAQERRSIVDALYKELELREQRELSQGEAVISMMTGTECFAVALSRHFGDQLTGDQQACGSCSWCETHTPIVLMQPPKAAWNDRAFKTILSTVADRDDARYLARIAFGISSPRVTVAGLGKSPVFGSMEDHDFMALYRAFAKVCDAA